MSAEGTGGNARITTVTGKPKEAFHQMLGLFEHKQFFEGEFNQNTTLLGIGGRDRSWQDKSPDHAHAPERKKEWADTKSYYGEER